MNFDEQASLDSNDGDQNDKMPGIEPTESITGLIMGFKKRPKREKVV